MNNKKSGNFFGVEQREASQKIGEDNALGKAERIEPPKKILEIQAEGENMGNIESPTFVSAEPKRRKFSNAEKIAICEEAVKTPKGKLGELLRKTGIYWSQLSTWRKTYEAHGSEGFSRNKNEKQLYQDLILENEKLKKENYKLNKNLKQAELIIDVQKKISEILEINMVKTQKNGLSSL